MQYSNPQTPANVAPTMNKHVNQHERVTAVSESDQFYLDESHLRCVSTSDISLGNLFFFCMYLANEYHTPPAVLITSPVTFKP